MPTAIPAATATPAPSASSPGCRTTYYTNGKRWHECVHEPTGDVVLTYDPEQHLVGRRTLDKIGAGSQVTWSASGALRSEGHYRDRHQVGLWREYDEQGAVSRELVYADDGRLLSDTQWNDAHVKTYELLPSGQRTEYYPDGSPHLRRNADGSAQRWHENGRLAEETRHVGEEWLLWNAWTEDGKQVVKNGNGAMRGVDGELLFPILVTYRGGREVSRKLLPTGSKSPQN